MIFCFSGTGNSRYIAQRIAEALPDPVIDLNVKIKAGDHSPIQTGRNVIVVTPTYAWRIPHIASDWLAQTELTGAERVWFVMNCGSEIGNAAKYNRQLAGQKNLRCGNGADRHAGKLYRHVRCTARGGSPGDRATSGAGYCGRYCASGSGTGFRRAPQHVLRPLHEWPGQPGLLPFLRESQRISGKQLLHRLRAMRPQVPDEQHSARKRQTRLGQGMHPLHGLYLLLPGRSHQNMGKRASANRAISLKSCR